MKNVPYHIPMVFLFAYLTLCFFRPPVAADAIIVAAVCGLAGFLQYVKASKEYVVVEDKATAKIKSEIDLLRLEKEKTNLKIDLTRINHASKEIDRVRQPIQF